MKKFHLYKQNSEQQTFNFPIPPVTKTEKLKKCLPQLMKPMSREFEETKISWRGSKQGRFGRDILMKNEEENSCCSNASWCQVNSGSKIPPAPMNVKGRCFEMTILFLDRKHCSTFGEFLYVIFIHLLQIVCLVYYVNNCCEIYLHTIY